MLIDSLLVILSCNQAGPGYISSTECRLGHHICLLQRLGLHASPVMPGFCDVGEPAAFDRFRRGS